MNGELWQPAERAPVVRKLYEAAEARREKDPAAFAITAEGLIEKAKADTGFGDFGGDDFRPRLDCLVEAIRETARLNALGTVAAGRELTGEMLRGRLELEELRKNYPKMFERPVRKPLFIVGGSRTGTTLLQRLLSADPRNRSPLLWEMTAATALARRDDRAVAVAQAKAEMSQKMLHLMNPTMKQVHFSDAYEPEECVLMMGTDLRNWALQSCMNVPGYCGLLSGEDFTESYERHKQMLQALAGDNETRQWVLKAPYHLPELPSLMRVYPDARILITHRDPVDTITSTCSLFAVFRSGFSDDVDPVEVGRQQVEIMDDWFRRSIRARDTAPSGAVCFDVHYDRLVKDPLRMIGDIYEAFGIEFTPEARSAMERHLSENRKDKHGGHRYSPEMFGLDADETGERFRFYSERFGIGR